MRREYARWFMVIICGDLAVLRHGDDGDDRHLKSWGRRKTGFYHRHLYHVADHDPLAALGAFVLDLSPYAVISIIKFNIVLEALVGIWRIRSMKWVRNLTED